MCPVGLLIYFASLVIDTADTEKQLLFTCVAGNGVWLLCTRIVQYFIMF
jgi:hypothetical protein